MTVKKICMIIWCHLKNAFKIKVHKSAQKDIEKLPPIIWQKFGEKIKEVLTSDPYSCEPLHGKDLSHIRKLKYGGYRCLFTIDDQDVIILLISNRKNCYEKIKRRN